MEVREHFIQPPTRIEEVLSARFSSMCTAVVTLGQSVAESWRLTPTTLQIERCVQVSSEFSYLYYRGDDRFKICDIQSKQAIYFTYHDHQFLAQIASAILIFKTQKTEPTILQAKI